VTDRRLWLSSKVNALLDELGSSAEIIAQRLQRDDTVGLVDDEYGNVVGNWIADKFFIDPISVRVWENQIKISEDGLSITCKLPEPVLDFIERWCANEWPDLVDDEIDDYYEEFHDR